MLHHLSKAIFICYHVAELQPFFVELWLVDGLVRRFDLAIVEDVIVRIDDFYFHDKADRRGH